MSTLGIVVAVTAEARSLSKQSVPKGELIRLPDGALLAVSGIGPRRAAVASKNLLEKGATGLLSWGSAGGLSPIVSPGSLILPRVIIASDQSRYHVDDVWHGSLCDRLKRHVSLHTDSMVESTTVVCTPSEKSILFRRTGAIGVDMESAAVGAVAQEAGVPFMVVRAVADPADTAIPRSTFNAFDEFGRVISLRLIEGLVRHPTELFALFRVGRNYRAAQKTLAAVVRLAGNNLLAR